MLLCFHFEHEKQSFLRPNESLEGCVDRDHAEFVQVRLCQVVRLHIVAPVLVIHNEKYQPAMAASSIATSHRLDFSPSTTSPKALADLSSKVLRLSDVSKLNDSNVTSGCSISKIQAIDKLGLV